MIEIFTVQKKDSTPVVDSSQTKCNRYLFGRVTPLAVLIYPSRNSAASNLFSFLDDSTRAPALNEVLNYFIDKYLGKTNPDTRLRWLTGRETNSTNWTKPPLNFLQSFPSN